VNVVVPLMVSLSNDARPAFDKLRLNGWLCNSFSIDYAWLVQRESIGYPD